MTVTSDPSPTLLVSPATGGVGPDGKQKPRATCLRSGVRGDDSWGGLHEGSSPPRHVSSVKTTSTLAVPRPRHCVPAPSVCCRPSSFVCSITCLCTWECECACVCAHHVHFIGGGGTIACSDCVDIVIGANHKQKCDNPKCLQKESRIKSSALYSTAPQPVYSRLGKSHVCVCVARVVVSISREGSPWSQSFCVSRKAPLVSDRIYISLFLHLQFRKF